VSCFIASVISGSQLARDIYYKSDPDFGTVLVNVAGLFLFASLFLWDQSAAATRLDRREKVNAPGPITHNSTDTCTGKGIVDRRKMGVRNCPALSQSRCMCVEPEVHGRKDWSAL
jgi:hypothetical protein